MQLRILDGNIDWLHAVGSPLSDTFLYLDVLDVGVPQLAVRMSLQKCVGFRVVDHDLVRRIPMQCSVESL